jgi:hypothetical protein
MTDEKGMIPAQVPEQSALAALQQQNAAAMQVMLAEFARMLAALDEQNRRLQKIIESRVTITTAQARMLSRAIGERAAVLCDENRLPYAACGRRLREAISRELKAGFTVAAVGDIPAVSLAAAVSFVRAWSSFKLVRELRRKYPPA